LYYDSEKSDNDEFIGDTGSTVAQSVWDDNFIAVYHMSQDPSVGGACILDSTRYNDNASIIGTFSSNQLVDTGVGKAIDFTTYDNFIKLPSTNVIPDVDSTIEALVKMVSGNGQVFGKGAHGESVATNVIKFRWYNNTFNYSYETGNGTNGPTNLTVNIPSIYNGNYNNLVVMVKSNSFTVSVNGEFSAFSGSGHGESTAPAHIGPSTNDVGGMQGYSSFLGQVREFRSSKITRSDTWIKTTYNSNFDNLNLYYNTENYISPLPEPQYFYHGYIKEKGNPVQREVYLYERDTGKFINYTISDSSGYYLLEAYEEKEHFITVFDDDKGEEYQPITQDKLLPNGK
jgi:hypothetical protein